ncbi:hypothetical protein [Methylobacterium trifolii]|uniref:hypothetical protein n=1 Tax=Methylobacterium trifolii TaxID=1003092 RepID=UPI001EDF1705|nr:hypothetical protein [Methylobacterium trifolii]
MSTASTLKERLGLPAQTRDAAPERSGFPRVVELRCLEPLAKPVSFAKALQRYGVDLAEAHKVLNDLKERGYSRLQVYLPKRRDPLEDLQGFGVAISDPYRLPETG